jgi:hypothetical protein
LRSAASRAEGDFLFHRLPAAIAISLHASKLQKPEPTSQAGAFFTGKSTNISSLNLYRYLFAPFFPEKKLRKNLRRHISNPAPSTLLEQRTITFSPEARPLAGMDFMKYVIRLLLALALLSACTTTMMADGGNPPPTCTPANCPAGG